MATPTQSRPAAAASPDYDPTSAQPYVPPDPSATTPPPITAPPPILPDASSPVQSPRSLLPGRKSSVAASIATMGNALLKGFIAGKQQAQVRQADKANKMLGGLRMNYETAKANYITMIANGADPNSPEVKQAQQAADAAWMSMMQMYGNYAMPDKGKGKGKGKSGGGGGGNGQGDGDNPIELMMSKDPHEKVRGWYMMMAKAGPDYKYQAAQYLSPEYQQQVKLQRGSQAATGRTQEAQTRFDELEKKEREGTITEQEKKELEISKEQRFQVAGKIDKKVDSFVGPDNKRINVYQRPDGSRYQEVEGEVRAPASETKPIRAWSVKGDKVVSVEIDPKTNQIIPGTENDQLVPPAALLPHIRTSEFTFIDAQGVEHRLPTTSTSQAVVPSAGHASAAPTTTPTPAAAPAATTTPTTPAHTAAPAAKTPPAPKTKGDRVIGQKGVTTDINSQNAMRVVMPIIDETIGLLEPHKTEGGWTDSVLSHAKYWAYSAGIAGSALQDKIKQLEGFIGIAGASPWSKVGRGKYIFEQTQVHLPKPTDSPELAYHKLTELKEIYGRELQSAAERAKMGEVGGGGGAGAAKSKTATMVQVKAYATKKGITEAQAEQEFTDAGYQVQKQK